MPASVSISSSALPLVAVLCTLQSRHLIPMAWHVSARQQPYTTGLVGRLFVLSTKNNERAWRVSTELCHCTATARYTAPHLADCAPEEVDAVDIKDESDDTATLGGDDDASSMGSDESSTASSVE